MVRTARPCSLMPHLRRDSEEGPVATASDLYGAPRSPNGVSRPGRAREMSVRSEIVRLALRAFIKRCDWRGVTVEQNRRFATACGRLIPNPPASTRTLGVNAG